MVRRARWPSPRPSVQARTGMTMVSVVLGHGCDFTSEDSVADDRVDQHERKDEEALSPEHECKTGMRRCRFVDGEDEGDHVRPERDGQGAKGRHEDRYDHRKWQFIPAVSNTDREHYCR